MKKWEDMTPDEKRKKIELDAKRLKHTLPADTLEGLTKLKQSLMK